MLSADEGATWTASPHSLKTEEAAVQKKKTREERENQEERDREGRARSPESGG